MPSTITAYNTFTAGTKAKAAEVNANFSNHRGTLVPINENTASASDLSHDIGSSEHRWQTGYFGTVDMAGSTSTTDVKFVPRTGTTSGGLDLLFGSSTIMSWDSGGLIDQYVTSDMRTGLLNTISAGGSVSLLLTIASSTIPNCTLTITTSGGRVLCFLLGESTTSQEYGSGAFGSTGQLRFKRDASIIGTSRLTSVNTSTANAFTARPFIAFDAPASGTYVYTAELSNGSSFSSALITDYYLMVLELK